MGRSPFSRFGPGAFAPVALRRNPPLTAAETGPRLVSPTPRCRWGPELRRGGGSRSERPAPEGDRGRDGGKGHPLLSTRAATPARGGRCRPHPLSAGPRAFGFLNAVGRPGQTPEAARGRRPQRSEAAAAQAAPRREQRASPRQVGSARRGRGLNHAERGRVPAFPLGTPGGAEFS